MRRDSVSVCSKVSRAASK